MAFHQLKVSHIERLTEDSVRLDFFPVQYGSADFNFKAGQYLTLETEINGSSVRRSYSLCSSPESNELSVGIKEVPGGVFSTFANRTLAVNDVLNSMVPMGSFVNPDECSADKQFVYFAAGSGITPILSMIKTTLECSEASNITLFYGNKNVRSIMFHEELEALKNVYIDRFRIYHILSRQQQDSELFNGRIDGSKIEAWDGLCMDSAQTDGFYLCGPEAMIMSAKEALEQKGVPSNKIHFELFTSSAGEDARKARQETESSDENAKMVELILDGKKMEFTFGKGDDNILDKALQMGADLPFACKGGVCCTCKAKIAKGTAEMYVNYGLEADEIEKGFTLTCQAYPTSDSITIDFDQV